MIYLCQIAEKQFINFILTMKTTKTINLLVLLCFFAVSTMTFTSCAETEDGSFVNPITLNEKITGQWVLNSITQVDETNNKTMPLTGLFNFDSFAIHLNVDGDNNPTTFTVDGTAPALLPTTGNWKLDYPFVKSDGGATGILLNNNVKLTVTAVPGSQQTLAFKLTRNQAGKPFVSYVYNLVPAVVAVPEK